MHTKESVVVVIAGSKMLNHEDKNATFAVHLLQCKFM
jgi:hypothetical protein